MNHAACREEEKRLEEGVVEQVVQGGTVSRRIHFGASGRVRRHDKRPGAESEEHVAELRNRGEGEDPLDVVVDDGHGRGEKRGEPPDGGDHEDRGEGRFNPRGEWDQEDERPGRQVDARLDHRRGMDQGADRCRAFHRVREPGV